LLAISFLFYIFNAPDEESTDFEAKAALEQSLRTAADDPVPEVAGYALVLLGSFPTEENVDLLLAKLRSHRHNNLICMMALSGLGQINNGNERVLAAIISHTQDPDTSVGQRAIYVLGGFAQPRALDQLAKLLAGPGEKTSEAALRAFENYRYLTGRTDYSAHAEKFDPILLAGALNLSFSGHHRSELANEISGAEAKRIAYESLLLHPTGSEPWERERCLMDAARGLAGLGVDAAPVIPSLRKVLSDSKNPANVHLRIERTLETIEAAE
jgi:hypothetical protein